jgi:hypothetical protein
MVPEHHASLSQSVLVQQLTLIEGCTKGFYIMHDFDQMPVLSTIGVSKKISLRGGLFAVLRKIWTEKHEVRKEEEIFECRWSFCALNDFQNECWKPLRHIKK